MNLDNDRLTCGICKRQSAKYTCPSCNVGYCSLTCYRSEAHSQCTEPFYRRTIEAEIRSQPSKTLEEKKAMLDILKRLEEQGDSIDGNEGSDGDEFIQRFKGIDIDAASSEQLWSALNPKQRNAFLNAMQNPSSSLAQELLASDEIVQPWWEVVSSPNNEGTSSSKRIPELMDIDPKLIEADIASKGYSRMYNILAITFAYVSTTRTLNTSPLSSPQSSQTETISLISQLVPFLTNRKVTSLLRTVDECIAYVASRLPPDTNSIPQLLKDASRLLTPPTVTVLSTPSTATTTTSSTAPLLMLSDLFSLFTASPQKHVPLKLKFYAAHVVASPDLLRAMVSELAIHARASQSEQDPVDGQLEFGHSTILSDRKERKPVMSRVPKVEEVT